MSFEEDFLRELSTDLATALGLPGGAVYLGRAAQKVTRQGLEVWIRPAGSEAAARGLTLHAYEIHLRWKGKREGDQTGWEQLRPVRAALEALRRRYDGTRPFSQAIPALVAVQVEETDADRDPEDQDVLTAVLQLRALEAARG